jgi:citrate lyase beta subunit
MADVTAAQNLVRAFEDQQAAGMGVFEYDGKMVDMPMIRAANEILRRAKACGLISSMP